MVLSSFLLEKWSDQQNKKGHYVLSDMMNSTFFWETGLHHETEHPFRGRVAMPYKKFIIFMICSCVEKSH
jgi:hypothetical protein